MFDSLPQIETLDGADKDRNEIYSGGSDDGFAAMDGEQQELNVEDDDGLSEDDPDLSSSDQGDNN